jgi:predicted ATPase/class 3 adenylate cyclase
MSQAAGIVTFLFTDIEGSTRLWEADAARMETALARHDALARDAVTRHRGRIVKTTGDGVHAVFDDPLDAVRTALDLELGLAKTPEPDGVALAVRCGIHMGAGQRRDGDFYGRAINRAARIMSAAHGGQVLVSQAVADVIAERIEPPACLRDLGLVRLKDLAAPERIYQLAHPGLRATFPPLRSLESTPNNLPAQLTSFVGRERQLAEVAALIRKTRLVTLVGPGGIGKTRLALHAAAEVMDAFPDGVFLAEFAPLADARLLPQAVASVLGVKEEAGRPIVDTLAGYARGKRLLLVFDNCEHVAQAAAELAHALLRGGADLHIVASSREPLAIAGEQLYPVPALSVPREAAPSAQAPSVQSPAARRFIADALVESEAARLFVERATAARPGFAAHDDDVAAIAGICRQLDGIPLAIELAAACTRTMSPARIAERLSDRFRLLASGDRTALPRQQTLRALIDWSFDLLTPAERALLRRLAVFAGGFTLDAAEAVGAGGEVSADDALDLVTRLVEKSLVVFDADRDRYNLLETVREYAADRLREAGEEADVRSRHLRWALALAQRAAVELTGPAQGEWLTRLDGELENLLAAHAHCATATDGAEADMRLADATKLYWFNRGLLGVGLRVTSEALARPDAHASATLRARLLLAAGQFRSWAGQYDKAYRALEESLAIARGAGDAALVATVLQPLGLAALGLGRRSDARACLEEALALAREGGDARELAAALNQMAQIERMDGRMSRADEHYRQALDLARRTGDLAVVAVTLLNVAMTAISRGEAAESTPLLRETLAIARDTGDRLAGISTLDACTALAAALDDFAEAARFHGMAEALLAQSGMQRDPVDSAFVAPWIDLARRRAGAAFEGAERDGRALDYAAAVEAARTWLAQR